MSKFKIRGGKRLYGEIKVCGSKNALLPVLAATLLTRDWCLIKNVPNILDGKHLLEIISDLGAEVKLKKNQVLIRANRISANLSDKVRKLRGSILLAGALIPRLKKFKLPYPGGDLIGKRPIDTHLNMFEDFGVKAKKNLDSFEVDASMLSPAKVVLSEISVTATENALLCSVLIPGKTVIKLAAVEPHVIDLARFLNKMGAKISGIGTHTLKVEGVKKLHGAEHRLIPDSDEAMSLITLAVATRSNVLVSNLNLDFIEAGISTLRRMGANLDLDTNKVLVKSPKHRYFASKIQSGLYPKLSTDQIPPLAVLCTQAKGCSLIHEWMYENRLGYIPQLRKMGANARILDPHRALIFGPTPLHGINLRSLDIRAGMAILIAALVAKGESILSDVYVIDRGYQKIESRLKDIGAEIERIE